MKILAFLLLTLTACASEWTSLFDGKSLAGWKSLKGTEPGKGWKVVDGTLHLDGFGGDIVAPEEYDEFELVWTWKISQGGNNGIKYWVVPIDNGFFGPEYQMIDDQGHRDARVGKKRSTACLYDILPAAEDKLLKPVGEWNESRIVTRDLVIEHYLNGKLVCKIDTKSPEWRTLLAASKFRNRPGYAPGKGKIMITDHGDKVWFKEIKVRKITKGS